MGKFLEALINPLINIVATPIRLMWFVPLAAIGLIGFTIFNLLFFLFKLFSLDLNNYLMFNLLPGQSYSQFSVARPWYQFLIISFILWLINFFVFIIRYSKESNGLKAKEIFVQALKSTVGGVLTLILFQVVILFINIIFIEVTKALYGDYNDFFNFGFGQISNNIIRNMMPPKGFVPSRYWDPFPNGFPIANPLWGLGFPAWWELTANITGYALTIGLSIAIVGVLISIPLIFVLFDIISRVFINWLLFISFPLIPAFSINDGGKRIRVWKEKYFGNLLSCSIYGVGIMMLGSFIGLANTFMTSAMNYMMGVFSSLSSTSNNFAILKAVLTLLSSCFLIIGSAFAFKKLSEIAIAFVGSEVSGGQSAKLAVSGAKAGAGAYRTAKDAALRGTPVGTAYKVASFLK
ncbi:Mbov_0396 family ICE element transmembrane protein [Metamycoplasma hominis]|uniref:Mbov_0396 family ICE element transmembrane protein n=1 Tax=Metamycoplasma hominis TaxID=2098 RepID=UPI0005C8ADDB|nr:hypothetical protein [Metamycoplasma hominis]